MKVTYSNREGETITRVIPIGQKLVGLRLNSVVIESHEEFQALLSEKGLQWAKRNLNFRPSFASLKPQLAESNWGSDWVDDGV
jgi:hypothetical protein